MDYFTKISELNAKKAGLIEKANALIDKGELGGELEEVKNEIKSTQSEIEKVSEIAALSEKSAKKPENKQGSRPFATLGEQLTAIRNAAKGQVDERLYAVNNEAKGANRQKGADGGYALQEDFAASILESAASSGEILSRVTSYTVGEGSSSVRWLRVDEDDISSSVCGGVRMYWAAEGYGVGASKPKFAETKLDLEKMMGYAEDTLNKSDFCDKSLKYRGFYRKNNLKSEASSGNRRASLRQRIHVFVLRSFFHSRGEKAS